MDTRLFLRIESELRGMAYQADFLIN